MKNLTSKERVEAWLNGKLGDEDLSQKDIRRLEKLTMDAIHRKLTQIPGKIMVNAPRTLQ